MLEVIGMEMKMSSETLKKKIEDGEGEQCGAGIMSDSPCCSTADSLGIGERLEKLIALHKELIDEPEAMSMVSRHTLIAQLEMALTGKLCR